ncbi:MAG: MFS transporter, partial [Deltaproteobacteria bacterium]|nr:MFS transporter [Deltaproteobacteria bacterium]
MIAARLLGGFSGMGKSGSGISGRRPTAIVGAIVILLLYQGYSLSVVGAASPWIAQSFSLDQAHLARLFAWMSLSAFGSLMLARLADRLGRRHIILLCLSLAPLFSLGAALAPSPLLFAGSEVLIAAVLGGSVSSAIVLLAEELPIEGRARGQAFAAMASAVGGVLSYVVIPFLLRWGFSWRWLLAPSVAGIGLVLPLGRMVPVSPRWASAASRGEIARTRFYDIFHPLCRTRALTLLACAGLDTMAGTAVNSWLYFEAVSILGLSPQMASTLVVVGMGVGMLGFPVGAWTSEYYGRVPTVVYVGGAAWLGALAFYWGPPEDVAWPMIWLLGSYCWFKMAS